VGVGYLDQSFDNDTYGSISGLSTRVRLEYFPTQLLTIGATADRSVGDSGAIGSAGFMSSAVQFTADYELRRNVIIEGRVGFINEDYDVIDRQNDRWTAGVRGTYLINRRLGVTAGYEYESRRSSGIDRINDFNTSRFMVSLVAQY
ncbi:MAG: outer membrane beta-barrel protein, partial [Brevundimonas sp.]